MAKDDRGIYYRIDAEALSSPEEVRTLWLGKTDALPAELVRFVNLESLDLDGSRTLDWDAATATLRCLPALSTLRLRNCALSPNRFPIATLRALKLAKLVLGSPDLTDHPNTNLFTRSEGEVISSSLLGVEVVLPRPADELPETTDFGSSLPAAGTRHIKDPAVKALYWHLHHDPYRTLRHAERLRATATDPLAVLEAMKDALDRFLAELAKLRGFDWSDTDIQAQYGHQWAHLTLDRLPQWHARVVDDIATLRAAGAASRIYPIYERARIRWEDKLDEVANELVEQMEDDLRLEGVLVRELKARFDAQDHRGFVKALRRGHDVDVPSPRFGEVVTALTNNLIVLLGKAEKTTAAKPLVVAYAELRSSLTVSDWLVEEIAGNSLACCSNDRKLRDLVLARLVPGDVYDARLAFNLACVHAAGGNKAQALQWIAQSIELGRDPASFLGDSDFRTLWHDPDFARLVPGDPKPQPKPRPKPRKQASRARTPRARAASRKKAASRSKR